MKYRAYTDDDKNSIILVDEEGQKEYFELFHSNDRVSFDAIGYAKSDPRWPVLDAEITRLNQELYGSIISERELLLEAVQQLSKGKKSDQLKLASRIQDFLLK